MTRALVFTPTYGFELETIGSIFGMEFDCPRDYHITHYNVHSLNEVGGARLNVQAAYTRGRDLFLGGDYTHLMIVEADIVPPPDAWLKLKALAKPLALALYCLRPRHSGGDFLNACPYFGGGDIEETYSFRPELLAKVKDGASRVSGVGLGCVVIERRVMEAIPFRGIWKQYPDWPFWQDVIAKGFEAWCDFTVRCGHKDSDHRIYWPFGEEPEWFGEVRKFAPYEPIETRDDMTKIRALTSFAGPHGAFVTGQVEDVPDWLAKDWIEAGFAELVEKPKPKTKAKRKKEDKAQRAKEDK